MTNCHEKYLDIWKIFRIFKGGEGGENTPLLKDSHSATGLD